MKQKRINLTFEQKTKLAAWIQLTMMLCYLIHCVRKDFSGIQAESMMQRERLRKQKEKLDKVAFQGQLKYQKQINRNQLSRLKAKAKR